MTSHSKIEFNELRDRVAGAGSLSDDNLNQVACQLNEWANELAVSDDGCGEKTCADGATTLAQLVRLAVAVRADENNVEIFNGLNSFVAEHVLLLGDVHDDSQRDRIESFIHEASVRWGDYLVCLTAGDENQYTGFDELQDGFDKPNTDPDSPAPDDAPWNDSEHNEIDISNPENQIELLLSAIGNATSELELDSMSIPASDLTFESDGSEGSVEPPNAIEAMKVDDGHVLREDSEMCEAFLDDASRCLDIMEKSTLAVEQNPGDTGSVRQFCRELHTLKGASGSVGLAGLAAYIHQVETSLESVSSQATDPAVESMLAAVDHVRHVVNRIRQKAGDENSASAGSMDDTAATTASLSISNHSAGSESLIRIRVSKLDRLMDMLAELVVLRNRRESHIAEFSEFNEELSRCSSRLSFCQDSHELLASPQFGYFNHANAISGSNTLSEIAKDISVVSASIRDLQKPVSKDNLAISHFIRDFRQELMQLRRVPIAGLFHRLQRAARDAARKEGKTIQLLCLGQETGLEQELQEKLHEPLLHIIRNAVSHGIEAAKIRKQAGKKKAGTITLEAQSNSQLLAIEIRDDGGGLDYDAIRRRAIDKGLIGGNPMLSHQELGRLIFHPGFSTCQQATEVSGRGVGMDIVAGVLEQMRGRIEIDSSPGKGTTMRLVVPLRSAIEHVMVFRTSGQLFALPTQSVSGAHSSEQRTENIFTLSLSAMLSLPETKFAERSVLTLTGNRPLDKPGLDSKKARRSAERIGLAVDEIVGPEEVVVRNIPAPLNSHPLFCGLTLSGAGETVLLLDVRKLTEFFHQFTTADQRPADSAGKRESIKKKCVLIVDDSLSARKLLVKKLTRLGYRTEEAGDGMEGLELLRQGSYDLVFTDLDMPRLGGLEMLFDMQQRRGGENRGVPVVVVSSRSEHEFRDRCLDSGAKNYLVKPVNDDSLDRVLNELKLEDSETDIEDSNHE